MRVGRGFITATGFVVAVLATTPHLRAEVVLNQPHCVPGGLGACMTVTRIAYDYYAGKLMIDVTNSSTTEAFIGSLLLDLNGDIPKVAKYAEVNYGGDSELWRATDNVGNIQGNEYTIRLSDNAPNKKGGNSALRFEAGASATITVMFDKPLEHDVGVNALTGHLQAIGGTDESGFTVYVTPEPVTVILLASGLLAIGGISVVRRRQDTLHHND